MGLVLALRNDLASNIRAWSIIPPAAVTAREPFSRPRLGRLGAGLGYGLQGGRGGRGEGGGGFCVWGDSPLLATG